MTSTVSIAQELVHQGHLTTWQLQSALAHLQHSGGALGDVLVDMGFVPEPIVTRETARHLDLPSVDLARIEIPIGVLRLIPERLIRRRRVLPLRLLSSSRGPLVVASADPRNLEVLDEAAFAAGMRVEAVLAGRRAIERAIDRFLGVPGHPPLPSALRLLALPGWPALATS